MTIGGCRTQKEPGHGGLSTYETFILWLKFNSLSHFFLSWQQGLPGHSPGMPWPAAAYVDDHRSMEQADKTSELDACTICKE